LWRVFEDKPHGLGYTSIHGVGIDMRVVSLIDVEIRATGSRIVWYADVHSVEEWFVSKSIGNAIVSVAVVESNISDGVLER